MRKAYAKNILDILALKGKICIVQPATYFPTFLTRLPAAACSLNTIKMSKCYVPISHLDTEKWENSVKGKKKICFPFRLNKNIFLFPSVLFNISIGLNMKGRWGVVGGINLGDQPMLQKIILLL